MTVSATILSHCAMQLSSAAPVDAIVAAPFNARCNTAAAPRVRAAIALAAPAAGVEMPPLPADGARTHAEVVNPVEGDSRRGQYIQYTIEY